ncbi:MAG: hypothetical protein ACYDCB_02480 [Candidatus Dormibacteria bacterium]
MPGIIAVMSRGSAVTGRRILRALWLQDGAAAVARAAPLAAAIVANYRERFGVGPTWQELSLKLGIPPMGVEFPLRGSPEWIAWRAAVTELIPELIATGWLADARGVERSLNVGPRWEAAGASWLEHQSAVPNVRAYYFQHGPRPAVAPPPIP